MEAPKKEQLIEAIDALYDMGDQDSVYIISLIGRLLADDWTGTGVYQALDNALSQAEHELAGNK